MSKRLRTWQTQKTRDKIKAALIINRLQDGFEGKVDLSATQVKIGLGLLAKIIPDMSHHIQERVEPQNLQVLLEQARKILGDKADLILEDYEHDQLHEAGHA